MPQFAYNCHGGATRINEYGYFLRFKITQMFNQLMFTYNPRYWSEEQQATHDLIKSLHDDGLESRKIAQHLLNEKGNKAAKGNDWNNRV